MLDIKTLQNSGFFKNKVLEKGELLFDEGDFDGNLYIIESGVLQIEKYTTNKKNETKVLAFLEKGEIFGESALNSSKQKEVKITAKQKTSLIYIDAKNDFPKLIKKQPELGLNILKNIIELSNKRLLESNYLITANYKISQEIINTKNIDNKNLFELIQKLKDIVAVDSILYIEANPVMKGYLTKRYSTQEKGKMLDQMLEEKDIELLIKKHNYSNLQKLSIGDELLGILIFYRDKNDFSENDKKVLLSAGTAIAGFIKQKNILQEEKNKDYIKEF